MMINESSHRDADDSCSSVPDSGSNDVAEKRKQKLSIEERLTDKMFSYAREIICFFLAITFTALAALHSSSPKVSKPPAAKPFFNQTSIVLDFYKGHLGAMIERVTDADYSFVMYYAPWDAESQAVREEFEKVAQYYYPQIFFAAINCWHPNSECKAQYNKIFSYPVLMLYPSKDSGIQYKGIETAPYMIQFIRTVMNPIVRVTRKEQLSQLLVENDAVVLGFFNFTGLANSPGYKEFYKASLRSLERDPNRELVFAAVTKAISRVLDVDITKYPSLRLLMWNESLSYPEGYEWTSESILNWISGSIHQPALWLQPPGIKALTLAPYLREGPVLLLFTPRNPFHRENYNYNLLKEVGLHYFNCAGNLLAYELESRLRAFRRSATQRHVDKTQRCENILKEEAARSSPLNQANVNTRIQRWINDSCCANILINKCLLCKKTLSIRPTKITTCAIGSQPFAEVCRDIDVFRLHREKNELESHATCCNGERPSIGFNNDTTTMERSRHQSHSPNANKDDDPRSAQSVRQNFIKRDCRMWLTGNKYHEPLFPHADHHLSSVNLTRSVCKLNKTLALIAIDSLRFFQFAEALGIDVLKKKDKTAVVIVDSSQESQYTLQGEFSRSALIQLINNYTEGSVRRTLRSNNSRRYAQKYPTKFQCSNNVKKMCLPELTSDTFLSTVLDPTKDVVVMYHSPYCAFCGAIAHVYLTVAYYLEKMDHLVLVRVDGDNNDLPWEYNMNRFPSVLFFPARRKEDSTVFPFSSPITIPNLLNFILGNLEEDARIEALTNVCQAKAAELPDECVRWIRMLCLDVIERLLKDYRRLIRHSKLSDKRSANNQREIILLQLNHIRTIHLILGSTNNLAEDQSKVQSIRSKYKTYYALIRRLRKFNGLRRVVINQFHVNSFKRDTIKDEL